MDLSTHQSSAKEVKIRRKSVNLREESNPPQKGEPNIQLLRIYWPKNLPDSHTSAFNRFSRYRGQNYEENCRNLPGNRRKLRQVYQERNDRVKTQERKAPGGPRKKKETAGKFSGNEKTKRLFTPSNSGKIASRTHSQRVGKKRVKTRSQKDNAPHHESTPKSLFQDYKALDSTKEANFSLFKDYNTSDLSKNKHLSFQD